MFISGFTHRLLSKVKNSLVITSVNKKADPHRRRKGRKNVQNAEEMI